MKKAWLSILMVVGLTLPLVAGEASEWKIDPVHSSAQFAVKHLMVSTVRGEFAEVQGTAVIDEGNLSGSKVEVEIGSASIDTRNERRNNHLKSTDFLDVEKHPKLLFKSKRVEDLGDGKLKIVGDLTIRGITKEVALDTELSPAIEAFRGVRRGASATTTINRQDFDVSWNQALDAGGVVVGDEVRITIDVELIRAD